VNKCWVLTFESAFPLGFADSLAPYPEGVASILFGIAGVDHPR
jgi:hypothetical protein